MMISRTYIQEKIDRFAVDNGLAFCMCWNRDLQVWVLRFVNRKFNIGCDMFLSDKDIFTTDSDCLVMWIIHRVKQSNII